MIITVDGPAGSGKSTLAKLLATKLGGLYLDTGAMYRSVTLLALESGVKLDDEEAISNISSKISITFKESDAGQRTIVNGADRSLDIRTREIDSNVSKVAAYRNVRKDMVELQQKIALESDGKVVAEGRDTGSVVFTSADFKFYLNASPKIRAKRRADERGETVDNEKIAEIAKRDRLDSSREESPLVIPEGAITIDSSKLSIDETLQKVIEFIA